MSGEAAEEVVHMMLQGTEVTLRLTGATAKTLASILVAYSKGDRKVHGKTSMMKLLKSGEELQVFSLTETQYETFKGLARGSVLYALFSNKQQENGTYDVVIASKSIPTVNHILDKIGYGRASGELMQEDPQKKDTRPLEYSKNSEPRQPLLSEGNGRSLASTVVKLETYKRELQEARKPNETRQRFFQRGPEEER